MIANIGGFGPGTVAKTPSIGIQNPPHLAQRGDLVGDKLEFHLAKHDIERAVT